MAQISSQSFESSSSDNWAYTPTPAFGSYTASTDVWDIVSNLANVNSMPTNMNKFVGMRDLDNPDNTSGVVTLDFAAVDISNYTNVNVKFDYQVHGFDNGDDVWYTLTLDGVAQDEVQLVNGSSNLNANGTVTLPVADNVNSIALQVKVKQDGSKDYAGLDNFFVTGDAQALDIYEPTANTCESVAVGISGTEYVDIVKDGKIIAQINPNGNNLGITTVEVYKSSTARQDADGTNYLNRSIFIAPTTQPSSAVSVRLFVTQSEFNDLKTAGNNSNDPNVPATIDDLNFTKVTGISCGSDGDYGGGTGSEFISTTATAYGTAGHYLQFDVTGFSGFFGHGGSAPLPVEWKDVYVESNRTSNVIHWELSSEVNVDYYLVESSTDGIRWSDIATVDYNPTNEEYSYTDHSKNILTYYRVKQFDFDGKFSYSKIVVARNSIDNTIVYPNPVDHGKHVTLQCSGNVDIKVFNAIGDLMNIPIVKDYKGFILPTHKLSRGLYFIQINGQSHKLVIR